MNQFSEAWREPGVFYPRWLGSANGGQGSPVMLYYPPVTIFTAAALKILVGDTLRALALSCWLALAASGLTMYLFGSLLRNRVVCGAWVVTALSLLMTTKFSSAVWRAVPQIAYMQFPWRFLVISTAGMCVLGGGAASNWASPSRLRFISALALSGAAVFNLVLSVLLIARAPFGQEALDASTLRREVPKYRTLWWDGKLHEDEELAAVVISRGDASAGVIHDQGIRQSYSVNASTESELKFRVLYFPGWTARVDGKLAEIGPSEEGRIQLRLDQGEHSAALTFEDTWPRTAGKLISAAGLLLLTVMLYTTSNVLILKRLRPTHDGGGREN